MKKGVLNLIGLLSITGIMAQDNTFYMDDNSLVTIQLGAILHNEGDFHIDTNADLDNAGMIRVQGDWRFESATVDITSIGGADEQGLVIFQNNYTGNPHNVGVTQTIYAPNDMLGASAFYDVDLDNDNQMLDLNGGAIEIKNTLEFLDADDIFRTDATSYGTAGQSYAHKIYISNPSPSAIIGSSGISPNATGAYIEGKLERAITSGNYEFPIGVANGSVDNNEPFALNVNAAPTNGTVTGYIHNSPSNDLISNVLYCDVATHQGSIGVEEFGTATPGADGKLDKINTECQYSLAWRAESGMGTGWDYTFTGYPGTILQGECSFLNFNGSDLYYLAKDGTPVSESMTSMPAPSPWLAGTDSDGYQVCPTGSLSFVGTSFSEFRVGGSTILDEALPVELLSFSGGENGKSNVLDWVVASEINSSHYEIERSLDGIGFRKIGAENAQGNISEEWRYYFQDTEPSPISYYRLKMVDLDGSYEYSNIILIKRELRGTYLASIFPVPSKNELTIQLVNVEEINISIEIIDALGSVLYTEEESFQEGLTSKVFDVSQLVSGTYFIRLLDGKEQKTYRFVIHR